MYQESRTTQVRKVLQGKNKDLRSMFEDFRAVGIAELEREDFFPLGICILF